MGCVGSQAGTLRSWWWVGGREGGRVVGGWVAVHLGQLALRLDPGHDELGRETGQLCDVARGARVVARDHPDLVRVRVRG